MADVLSFEDRGAVGDGITDDTVAINTALSDALALGLLCVGRPGATYLVSQRGTKTFTNSAGTGTYNAGYAIELPNGISVDFRGSTITVNSTSTAVALSNKNTTLFTDKIEIRNVVVNGNGCATTAGLVNFVGCTQSIFSNIEIKNCSYVAFTATQIVDSYFDHIVAHDIIGQGVSIGGNIAYPGARCQRLTIGTLRAWRIATLGTTSQPGNGIFLGIESSTFHSLWQRNCAGGIKFGPGCNRINGSIVVHDGEVLGGESDYSTANCGFKVQGDTGADRISDISVSSVSAINIWDCGIFGRYADRIQIGTYIGRDNHKGFDHAEIDLEGCNDFSIGDASVTNCSREALSLGSTMGRFQFGSLRVLNSGYYFNIDPTKNFPRRAVQVLGGQGHIGYFEHLDNQTTPTGIGPSIFILSTVSAGQRIVVDDYRSFAYNALILNAYGNVAIRNPILAEGNSPLSYSVSLSTGATSTNVICNNVRVDAVQNGLFSVPILTITPKNPAARTLGIPYLTIVNPVYSGSTLTTPGNIRLNHGASAGGEVYDITVLGYQLSQIVPS